MLQIKHLSITHTKDLRPLLKDVSFVLREGDKAAIIGEEGDGKSTLLKLLYDSRLVEGYCEYTGEIIKTGRIGYLAQELSGTSPDMTVYEWFCAVEGFYDASPAELAEIARSLELPPEWVYAEQTVGSLSGGEKVKLQLASLLLLRPDMLLLDEPSNDLDMQTVEWLERFIQNAAVPVLYVSHDEMLLERTANVIIHLEQVRRKTHSLCTVSRCGYRQYVQERAASRVHQTQVARNEQAEYDKQQERLRRIQSRVAHEQNTISRADPHGGALLKKKMAAVKSMERRLEREHADMTRLPESEDEIFVRFDAHIALPRGKTILDRHFDELRRGERVLLRDLHLHVMGGEKVCFVGCNGVGKTTLLRQIAEELLHRRDIRAGYMPQDYAEGMDASLTPVGFLSVSGTKEELTRIRTYLGSMRYTPDEMEHPIAQLSGGQKAKLYFIAMNLQGCNVLVLDEPTRNFSPLSQPVIRKALRAFGGTIISISHDRKFITEVCDRVIALP